MTQFGKAKAAAGIALNVAMLTAMAMLWNAPAHAGLMDVSYSKEFIDAGIPDTRFIVRRMERQEGLKSADQGLREYDAMLRVQYGEEVFSKMKAELVRDSNARKLHTIVARLARSNYPIAAKSLINQFIATPTLGKSLAATMDRDFLTTATSAPADDSDYNRLTKSVEDSLAVLRKAEPRQDVLAYAQWALEGTAFDDKIAVHSGIAGLSALGKPAILSMVTAHVEALNAMREKMVSDNYRATRAPSKTDKPKLAHSHE